MRDSIVALATPRGIGALAVIRISGRSAFLVFGRCVRSKERFEKAAERRVELYWLVDPRSGEVVDQATAVKYVGPRSYTGEDMVEVITHGGEVTSGRVMAGIMAAGAREAAPGEFSMRAVMGGKMDVLKAEAMDLVIRSMDEVEHAAALAGYSGGHRDFVWEVRALLEESLARLEGGIETGEEDEGEAGAEARWAIEEACRRIEATVKREEGRRTRDGGAPCVVIAGCQNVGKSTLFNMLVGEERALVSDVGGTTRDFVSERVWVGEGWIRVVDTAGLGEAKSGLDRAGMERARGQVKDAWGVILVTDMSVGDVSEEECEVVRMGSGKTSLVVGTKTDLGRSAGKVAAVGELGVRCVMGSLVEEEGRRETVRVVREVFGYAAAEESRGGLRWNARQCQVLRRVVDEARMVLGEEGIGEDGLAFGMRSMLDVMGELTDVANRDDVLGEVFKRFCVGK